MRFAGDVGVEVGAPVTPTSTEHFQAVRLRQLPPDDTNLPSREVEGQQVFSELAKW